jgi:DNA-binding transcriptional ArsR family regulator
MVVMAGLVLEADIGAVAALIGETTRASEHLSRLEDAGLVRSARHGRARFFSVAGPDVANALEALAVIAPAIPVRSLRQSLVASTLSKARTCYDHLAGQLGVALLDDLLQRRALRPADPGRYEVTVSGDRLLNDLGVHVSALRAGRRPLARTCVDWTERRPHLAGALGAAICQAVLDRGWVTRRDRMIEVTEAGRVGFANWLGPSSRLTGYLREA